VGSATLVLDEHGTPKYVIGEADASPRSRRGRRSVLPDPSVALARTPLERRPMKIFAFDPSRGRSFGNHLVVTVPFEDLTPGPVGGKVAVVDYDVTNDRYYRAVDVDDPRILMTGGLKPSDIDPRFHQQMCYAAVSGVIERFELGLGRPVVWPWAGRGSPPLGDRLRVYPHAMQEANAYYDRRLRGLLFGYFSASRDDAGQNLPGQIVYTCLSHDIVAHEATHALLDSVRPYFVDPTGPDAPAFHEAFADVMALLQHFSVPDALRGPASEDLNTTRAPSHTGCGRSPRYSRWPSAKTCWQYRQTLAAAFTVSAQSGQTFVSPGRLLPTRGEALVPAEPMVSRPDAALSRRSATPAPPTTRTAPTIDTGSPGPMSIRSLHSV